MLRAILLVLVLLSSTASFSQSKEQVYAGIILHIMKYSEWPSYNDAMVVGVVNDAQLTNALNKAATGRKIHFKNVSVTRLNGVSGAENADVLFLPRSSLSMLSEAQKVAKAQKILVITEAKSASAKGSGVNFIEVEGKLKFELYLSVLESVGIKVSEQLKKFAIIKS